MGIVVEEKVAEALINEYQDIRELLTENVTVKRLKAPKGSLCLWQFDVKAKSHYLDGEDDINPKETENTTFWVDVKEGYPKVKPSVYYRPNQRLASVNVFRNGAQCIDEWIYDEKHAGNNSSLLTTVQKTIKDIIHDPSVSRFDSMANSEISHWQKSNIENHRFPTCRLHHVFKMDYNSSPANSSSSLPTRPTSGTNPPALPTRAVNGAIPNASLSGSANRINPPALPVR